MNQRNSSKLYYSKNIFLIIMLKRESFQLLIILLYLLIHYQKL